MPTSVLVASVTASGASTVIVRRTLMPTWGMAIAGILPVVFMLGKAAMCSTMWGVSDSGFERAIQNIILCGNEEQRSSSMLRGQPAANDLRHRNDCPSEAGLVPEVCALEAALLLCSRQLADIRGLHRGPLFLGKFATAGLPRLRENGLEGRVSEPLHCGKPVRVVFLPEDVHASAMHGGGIS